MRLKTWLWIALFLSFTQEGCSTVSELFDSSGCLKASGGPTPGLQSGNLLVCRSGMVNGSVFYQKSGDMETIIINNGPEPKELDASPAPIVPAPNPAAQPS